MRMSAPHPGSGADEDEPLLTSEELAARWNLRQRTLESWRYRGRGPAFVRLGGRSVRYRLSDVLRFEDAQRQVPTNGSAANPNRGRS